MLADITPEEAEKIAIQRLGPRKVKVTLLIHGKQYGTPCILGITDGEGEKLARMLQMAVWPEAIKLELSEED